MKNSKIIRKLLTTVSIASVIVSAETLATSRYTAEANTSLSAGIKDIGSGRNFYGVWQPAAASAFVDGSSLYIYQASDIIADRDNAVITGLDLNHTKASLTVKNDLSLGSIIDATYTGKIVGGYLIPIKIEDNKTLTLTGQGATIPGSLFGYGATTINDDDYSALGKIDFDNKAATLTVQSGKGNIVFGAKTTAINTDNATLNVKSNLEITDNSFAKVKTINIEDTKTLKFSNNELKLLETIGSSINFKNASKLELNATGANAKINVAQGSLGGNAADDTGIIELTLNGNTTFSHKGGDVALVGINAGQRAKKFTINGNGYKLEVTGKIFAKGLEFNKGDLTFNSEVDTGAGGSSKFLDKTTTKFNKDSNLGEVNFNNTDSTIKVATGKKLTGTFIGDKLNPLNSNGTIIFEGAGELDSTATKIKELKVTGIGNIKLAGKNEIKNVIFHDNNVELAHSFELKGDINGTAQTTLNLGGDVTIDGNIGENAALKAINLANDHTKTLTVSGNTIKADQIKFDAKGGPLKLTHDRLNVGITSNIIVTDNKKGVINADKLDKSQSLVIKGNIGDIAQNKALSEVTLNGGGDLSLQDGDVNIDTITISDDSTITLSSNNSYRITTINNNPNKGKVLLGKNLTLKKGTSLGSDANKLEYISWLGDSTVTIEENAQLHALEITNTKANQGSITFNGNGKNIVNAQIGKGASKFKNLTIGANTELELKQGGHFASDTTLEGANSTLIIGGDYSSNKIVATVANNGAVQLNNAADINVDLEKQAAAVNAIAKLEVSGASVKISETGAAANHGLNTKTIKFTNAGVSSTLTVPTEFKLDGIDVDNVGKQNHTIVTSGQAGVPFKQTINAANHIGNDADNLVNIRLNGDNDILEVKTPNFFSSVTTGQAGKNELIFDAAGGKTYGIGESGKKLGKVTFADDTDNIGDVYANDVIVNDNKTVTFAKNADANIQLGHAGGVGSKVIFTDLTELKSNITAIKDKEGQVTFNNTATINNDIGNNGRALARVEFSGANKHVMLSGNIFADQIDFGSSNIIIPESIVGITKNASLNGDTNINGNIKLNNSILTFNSGDVTFGPNTTITTALKVGGGFGKIVTKTKITADSNMRTKTIRIQEEENVANGKYLFIDIQGGSFEFSDGRDALLQVSSNNQAYTNWSLEKSDADGNIYAVRKNVAKQKSEGDVKAKAGDEISQENGEELADNNKVITAIGYIEPQTQISETRGEAIIRTTTTVEPQVTDTQYNIEKAIDGIVLNRISDIFARTNNSISINDKKIESAVAAGDEDQEKTIGAWAIPFYSQANQKSKNKGNTAGYSAKTSGGIFGFDVMPNDNLVLGTAIGITKTDMKYKDLKAGDKSTINGLNFSLYGSQQLPDNFFIQGIASFNVGNVNNKAKQLRGNADNSVITEIAQSKYRSRSFDGEILLGYNAQFADLLLIPTAGLRYSKVNGISYKETGTKLQNRTVSRKAFNKVEGIIGTRVVGSSIAVDTNTSLSLGGHVFVTQNLSGKTPQVKAKLDGQTKPFIAHKDSAAKTLCNIGVNLTAKQNTMFEYGIGYDAYLASKYTAHQGSLKVRMNF